MPSGYGRRRRARGCRGGPRGRAAAHGRRRSGSSRPPHNSGLAGLDEKGEHRGELAGTQRIVCGNGVGISHGWAPECGKTARPSALRTSGLRPDCRIRSALLERETGIGRVAANCWRVGRVNGRGAGTLPWFCPEPVGLPMRLTPGRALRISAWS